jgi:hypothetical protein
MVGESPPIADAERDHTRERKKDNEGKGKDEEGRGGREVGRHPTAYPRRSRPICLWLPAATSACGGGGGIRVLLTM